MAFLEYQLTNFQQRLLVHEPSDNRRLFARKRKSKAQLALEEDIHLLRCRLEQMVVDGSTMTSEAVVEVSMLLDRKINEYMNTGRKSR
ncbi:aspartyl-phosphate phosphatase Spo0E family protein [Paenibacillus chartarius]|uniref:Aspartyl-phosphate phosphatase Spo0E family protein n=1 Tax=Paenibacillus chartarius TaxID=747481 RepID=A0ABV6DFQ6_9BACL